MHTDIPREIIPLAPEDSFLILDRIKNDFNCPVHFHSEYELNLILNGRGICRTIGDSKENIQNLELVLIGPNLPHGWKGNYLKSNRIHEITIQFHHDLFDSTLLGRRMMKPIKGMLERSARGILFSEKTSEKIKPKILKLSGTDRIEYFLQFVSILQELAVSRDQRMLSTTTFHNRIVENNDKMRVIYEYVQKNYQDKISLSSISEQVSMSTSSFSRFIKRRTGKTFIEYVNDIRIGYAARSLLETDLSIAEVAFTCGFNNIANFNRIFKKTKDRTPSQYREEFSGSKNVL